MSSDHRRQGGAALAFSATYSLVSSKFLSDRLCLASLKSDDGEIFNFLSVHMHHRGPTRSSQWRSLISDTDFTLPDQTIVLGDFNSVIVPTRDTASPLLESSQAPSTFAAQGARNLELEFIRKTGLQDSYAVVHSERSKDMDLGGFTWGFPPDPPPHSFRHNHQPSDPAHNHKSLQWGTIGGDA